MATREELLQLVSSLPDEALDAAHATLTRLTQPEPLRQRPDRTAALDWPRQMQQRSRERLERSAKPGVVFTGGGGMTTGPGGKRRGRHSFGYRDGEDSVHETNIVHDDCEFMVQERIRREEPTREVHFIVEVTGPDGTTARHEHRYPLPATGE